MTQLEIIKLIEARKTYLEQEREKENEEVVFCQEYNDNYKVNDLDSIVEINPCDLFIALYRSQYKKVSFTDLHNFVTKNKKLIREVNDENRVVRLFSELERVSDIGIFDEIQELLRDGHDTDSLSEMLSIKYMTSIVFAANVENIISLKDGYDLYSLMEMYKQDGEAIFKVKAIVSIIKELGDRIGNDKLFMSVAERTMDQNLPKQEMRKMLKKYLVNGYNIPAIKKIAGDAIKYVEKVLSDEKKRKRVINKELAVYDALEKELFKALENGEVTNINKLIDKVTDEDISLAVMKLVYEHNNRLYESIQEEYDNLSSSSSSHYQVLLANNNISADQYDVSTIMDNSIEDLTAMLEKLNKIGVTETKTLLIILQNSDLATVSYLETLLEKNIVSKEFLMKNPNVFSKDSDELFNLKTNIDYLGEKGLNVHYLRASQEMFLLEPKRVEGSIKILENYELIHLMKTGINCTFLQEENLSSVIDTLLELGYEKNLEESLEVLNYSNNLERLRILKELNIPISSTEELINILSSDKFLIPDEDISSYIYNAVDYLTPNVERATDIAVSLERLEEYSETNRTYSFNGVLISKNKVKRNLRTVSTSTDESDRLVFAVVHGSVLSDSEFAKINNLIRKTSEKTMKKTGISE